MLPQLPGACVTFSDTYLNCITLDKKILIVEDELIVAGDLRLTLKKAGYQVTGIADSVEDALDLISRERPALVLLDIYLEGDQTGIDLAFTLNESGIPFVYLSANSNREVLEAAKATQPFGFLVKPFREKDLLIALDIARYRWEHHHDVKYPLPGEDVLVQQRSRAASLSAPTPDLPNFEGIIGQGHLMQSVFHLVQQVAPLDTSVLILGESGTGKSGIADAVHHRSPRRGHPYIKVNCAALPAHLIESELFGHEKGAFTGATEKRIGKFERADGGTIFLDEIGDMPVDLQTKLLRVLQEREIERIGGKGTIPINVRIIAATNRDLEKEIAEGRFRLDLYYRLYVFPILLPALRERPEDLPLLAGHFAQLSARKAGKPPVTISTAAMQQLADYPWPGNVRELQNIMERTVLMNSDDIITHIQLPTPKKEGTPLPIPRPTAPAASVKTMEELERDHILSVLRKCKFRVTGAGGAAEMLNLPPSTLNSKMRRLKIVKVHKGG